MRHKTGLFAVGALLIASAAFAQTPPAPKPQAPATTPLFSSRLAIPFPDGAKIGFVDFQLVAQESAAGKAASLQLKSLHDLKFAEIEVKNQALKLLQGRQNAAAALTASAAAGNNIVD